MSDPSSSSAQPSSSDASRPEDLGFSYGPFAFARIRGGFWLVQVSRATPTSGLTPVSVRVYQHDFISIFRYSQTLTLHPNDLAILETIENRFIRYEEDGTVFLARNIMERMRTLTAFDSPFGTRSTHRRGVGSNFS